MKFAPTLFAVLAASLLLTALFPALSAAQPQPLGDAVQVNTTANRQQFDPAVIGLEDGFFFVWQSGTSPGSDRSGSSIVGRFANLDGEWQGEDFQINTITVGNQTAPSVVALKDGTFVVVWNGKHKIRGQRFEMSSGAPVPIGSEFVLEDLGNRYPIDTVVESTPGGGFVLVWRDDDEPTSIYGYGLISARSFDAEGRPDGALFTTDLGSRDPPGVAVVRSGKIWIADIWGLHRFHPAGFLLTQQYQGYRQPALAVNQRGRLLAAGSEWDDPVGWGGRTSTIFSQVFKGNGSALQESQEIYPLVRIVGSPTAYTAASAWKNRFVVAWNAEDAPGIRAQTIGARGRLLSQFEVTDRSASRPAVATSGKTIVVVWEGQEIGARFYR